jgi:large subunit ribosomal protein L21
MYAIIADGGRQYTVREGDELDVDFRNASHGDPLEFDRVLAVSDDNGLKLGQPTVAGAKVSAKVLGPQLGKKLIIQKLRRRKNSRRKTGHRQLHTRVRIQKIECPV